MRRIAAILLLGALPVLCPATVYYADPSGNDGNPGTESEPIQSMREAATRALPGDTVLFRDGEYRGFCDTRSGDGADAKALVGHSDHRRQHFLLGRVLFHVPGR